MRGGLDTRVNIILGLLTEYPWVFSGDEATSWQRVVGLVNDANANRRPVVTVWTKEKGNFECGAFERSFGIGSDGPQHGLSVYTIMNNYTFPSADSYDKII